jgi:tetratricopeptide (TPR) repeat protein
LFRPHEAIRIFESLTPAQIQFKAAQRQFHTSFLGLALHEAGEYDKELKVAREGRIAMPDEPHFMVAEIKALAALGRTTEVLRALHEAEAGKARFDRQLWNPAEFRLCAGAELLAHGKVADGRALIASAGEWAHQHLTDNLSIPTDVNCVHRLLTPLYYYSERGEARSFFISVISHDSLDLDAHEALGALAAHRGDREEMKAVDDWLVKHPDPEKGRISFARARMAAISGDTLRALDLLEDAMRQGIRARMHMHYDPDLLKLRSMPRYKQLFALRD